MTEKVSDPTPLTTPPNTAQEVIQQSTSSQDYIVLRFAVLGLMALGVVALLGSLVLAYREKKVPEGIVAIGAGSMTALATMLVRPPLYGNGNVPSSGGTGRRSS